MSCQDWEMKLYDEIMDLYQRQMGLDLTVDPIIYQQFIKVIEMTKEKYGDNPEKLREIVTNGIILMLTLFFNKKDDDFDDNAKLSEKDRATVKSVLKDAFTWVSTNVG